MLLIVKTLESYWRNRFRKKLRTVVGQLGMASWPRDFVAG